MNNIIKILNLIMDDIYIDDELKEQIVKKYSETFHNSYDLVRLAKILVVYFLYVLIVLFWNRRNVRYRFKI